MFKISSLKRSSDCIPTKSFGNLFHSLAVIGKNKCKYEMSCYRSFCNFAIGGLIYYIELINKAWLVMITSFFSVIYHLLSWHEWKRAGPLYGNLTCDAFLDFLIQICIILQQTSWGAYCFIKVSSVLSRTSLARFFPIAVPTFYPLKMADLYSACVVPCLVNKLL